MCFKLGLGEGHGFAAKHREHKQVELGVLKVTR